MTKTKTKTVPLKSVTDASLDLPIIGFDFIEFYVGNAKQAKYFFENGLGFETFGYKGLETGDREVSSYALRQNDIKILLTGSLAPDGPIIDHIAKHGDGVKSIGFNVKDTKYCYEKTIERGATKVSSPSISKLESGNTITASVCTFGDTIHTFIERENQTQDFLPPGYKPVAGNKKDIGLLNVDHIVGNVESGKMVDWVQFYQDVFGFHVFQGFNSDDISTQYSALTSRVMANSTETIKMPINEPAAGARKSQIQEYLDFYNAPGVQHIAVRTENIIETVTQLQKRGIEFLSIPDIYYATLTDRVGEIDEDIETLAKLKILVDREANGYLLQIFTKPFHDRPTLFFEIIQRKNGASGFGKGNFMSLFESLEREQDLRGNL